MNIEESLKNSIARFLKGLFPTVLIACDEDYSSMTEELDHLDSFAAYIVGGGTNYPKLSRGVGVGIFVKNDPGSVTLNQMVNTLAEAIKPMSSFPLYDGEDLVTNLVVTEPNLRGVTFTVDAFRTKGIEFNLRGAITAT